MAKITLDTSDDVLDCNQRLSRMYELAADKLDGSEEMKLLHRVRAYDNSQRLTFGRAQTSMRTIQSFIAGIDLAWFSPVSTKDQSYFSIGLEDLEALGLSNVLASSVDKILGQDGSTLDGSEAVMMTLFMHRVLVRPGETYRGFFHRDLAPRGGRIGTVIWYPQIRHELIDGLEFIAYDASQDIPLGRLRDMQPDLVADPSRYANGALCLQYPLNLPHGVRSGVHRISAVGESSRARVSDFVSPSDECFVKDLVIVTLSERTPVEE